MTHLWPSKRVGQNDIINLFPFLLILTFWTKKRKAPQGSIEYGKVINQWVLYIVKEKSCVIKTVGMNVRLEKLGF
jgi:hypothetical protein